MTWLYQGHEVTEDDIGDSFGFVYLITHIPTGKKYIGRKYLTLAGYKTVNGKRKKIRKESDWRDYWGSSKEFLEEVLRNGKDQYQREILRFTKSRTETSYYETKMIFETDALLKDEYANAWVTCKITAMHLRSLTKEKKEPVKTRKNSKKTPENK